MRLYGALSELAELVIRLASGKTVKVSSENQPSGASEKVVKIPDMGTTDEDKIVLETSQQTLNNKILAGTVTNGLSSIKVQNADITGTNNLQIPQGNSLVLRHLSSNGNRLYLGTGGAQPLEIADLVTTQTLENKIILSPNISGGTLKGANVGGTANGEPVSIEGTSKVKFVSNTIDTDKLALINGQKEIVSFPTKELGKAYGGTGVDGTNVTFPTTGVIVTEAGSQTLSNKTIGSVTAASGILSVLGTGALRLPFGTNAQKPAGVAADLKGMIRYNDEQDAFEGYNELSGWSALGGGGTTDRVSQAAHGFVVGDVLWLDPGNPPTIPASYKKARADAANTAEVIGMVSRVIDAGTFELTLSGEVTGLTGLVAGEVYFLSPSTDGAMTVTEPSVVGQVSSPVGVASSTTSLYVAPKRGVVVGGANLRTQIGLNGAALVSQTTNIQNVTAYTAGELAGWVYIDATTDRRFGIDVKFVKDAANAWKCTYQTYGDTPPAGFNVDVIVSGSDAFVQVQMPAVAGWVSGSVNFALNAPAVGATLPLQVDSANVSFTDIKAASAAGITFKEDGGTTTMTITDAGNVGIGTASPSANLDVPTEIRLRQSSQAQYRVRVTNTDGNGRILVDGDSSSLIFGTSPAGTNATAVERMRIDASGNLILGSTSSVTSTPGIRLMSNGNDPYLISTRNNSTNAASTYEVYSQSAGATRFYVGFGGTIYATNTTISGISDQRFKDNIEDLDVGLGAVLALKPRKFDWKEGKGKDIKGDRGFIAQEFEQVFPDLIDEWKDPAPEGEEPYKTVRQDLIPVLVKAIQEQQAQIEEMKAKLAALEAK